MIAQIFAMVNPFPRTTVDADGALMMVMHTLRTGSVLPHDDFQVLYEAYNKSQFKKRQSPFWEAINEAQNKTVSSDVSSVLTVLRSLARKAWPEQPGMQPCVCFVAPAFRSCRQWRGDE